MKLPVPAFPLPLLALAAGLLTSACHGMGELDLSQLGRRASWQLPERLVETLAIEPGDRVADLGAGDGYFLPYLSEAVGPEGRVFAVEVEAELVAELDARVAEQGLANVETLLGGFDDPKLPDGGIDLVFLVNTYHHIEQRPDYFARLRRDLSAKGRVAIVEPDANGSGFLHLFQKEGHMTDADALEREMASAGYVRVASHDFLPVQIFAVFTPEADAD